MATVYSNTNDGVITTGNEASWDAARDKTSGTADTNNTTDAPLIFRSSGRGGATYKIGRVFMYFDTSGITGTLSEATLKLRWSSNTESYIILKSTAFGGDGGTSLADADFNNVTWGTAYSAEITNNGTGEYQNYTLNAAALADITDDDVFIIAIVHHDYDYNDSAPGSDINLTTGFRMTNYSGTSSDPYIDYTVVTGYGHDVSGTIAGNIASVAGTTAANIANIIGV